jgi:tetratricopeptide (TPR) repeat protein
MRPLFLSMFLLAILQPAAALHAQATPLPPGTSLPDVDRTQASSSNDGSAQPTALVAKAEDEIVRGEYDKALSLLTNAIAIAPAASQQAARALYDRGYVEQEQQQIPAAEADFHNAIAADPKQFESHAALGRLLAQQEQWKPARQQLELAAALQPASGDRARTVADLDRTLARVDAQLHDTSAASDALMSALKLTKEQTADTLLAAQLAEDQNNYAGSEQEYKNLLTADPKSMAAAEGLARALIHQGKYEDAEPVLQQALQQAPNDPVLLAESATALAGAGKTQEAIPQLETLHRQNPNQPAVTRMLADLYSSGGQAASAEPLYQQLLANDPRNPDLLTAVGENLMREQKWPQAIETFQQSLDLQPQQGDAWSGLAFSASENQQYSLVLSSLDRRAEYLAGGPATLFLRANALDHLHRIKEAISNYKKFLDEAQGKFPDEEPQARQRLTDLQKSR